MFVSQKALKGRHLETAFCCRGEESNWCRLEEEEARSGTERSITAYEIPLALVASFKYLRRSLLAVNDNWKSVAHNLRRAWQNWAWISWVLIREGADARTLGRIYMEVVQAAMLYGLET